MNHAPKVDLNKIKHDLTVRKHTLEASLAVVKAQLECEHDFVSVVSKNVNCEMEEDVSCLKCRYNWY